VQRIARWRLDLDRLRPFGDQPRHGDGARNIERDANDLPRSIQSPTIAARSMSGAIKQLCPCPSRIRRVAAGVRSLISRPDRPMARACRDRKRGRAPARDRRQLLADVVVAQDSHA
jgi:hypothetical protein